MLAAAFSSLIAFRFGAPILLLFLAIGLGRTADRAIPAKYMQRRAKLSPEEWSNMFGERQHLAVPGNA